MPQRLTPLEVSMLVLDTAHTPAHIGTVDIFDAGPDGWDYERLLGLIRERISYVPRYRQRVRGVPARLAGPVWVDDESFDLTYHVRRSALPRPGTMEQLREFVGRVISRRLDRSRPLWEMYVVEGLEPNRVALVTKSHLSLVDGIDTVEITGDGVHKAAALAVVCARLGIDRSEVVALGDNRNDTEMLRWAGRGVAMGNAAPAVVAEADEQGAHHMDDGVALVIEDVLAGIR